MSAKRVSGEARCASAQHSFPKRVGNFVFKSLSLGLVLAASIAQAVYAQADQGALSTIRLVQPQIAQAAPVPSPAVIPTDATPFTVSPERNEFTPGLKFKIFQALPERLYFTASTEVSQRLDTNVFFTSGHAKQDYAFRVLPNITVGYNFLKNTSIFANYFVIKDVFAVHEFLGRPTTQSLAWGVQHNKAIGKKTNLQLTMQARELWQARRIHQFDFIPGATVTHFINANNIVYGSVLLQMRGGGYFVAPTREIDPFYTVGYIHRRGPWTFLATNTLVNNFRQPPFTFSIPAQSNISMIADFEVNRPIMKKYPELLAFVRAEPIWNWRSNRQPGLSGFDFRLYSGLRLLVSKPSYLASTDNLRRQLMKNKQAQPTVPQKLVPITPAPKTPDPGANSDPNASPVPNSSAAPGISTPAQTAVSDPSPVTAISSEVPSPSASVQTPVIETPVSVPVIQLQQMPQLRTGTENSVIKTNDG